MELCATGLYPALAVTSTRTKRPLAILLGNPNPLSPLQALRIFLSPVPSFKYFTINGRDRAKSGRMRGKNPKPALSGKTQRTEATGRAGESRGFSQECQAPGSALANCSERSLSPWLCTGLVSSRFRRRLPS